MTKITNTQNSSLPNPFTMISAFEVIYAHCIGRALMLHAGSFKLAVSGVLLPQEVHEFHKTELFFFPPRRATHYHMENADIS